MFRSAAAPKVTSSTGISIYVFEVKSSTATMMKTAMPRTTTISDFIVCSRGLPTPELT